MSKRKSATDLRSFFKPDRKKKKDNIEETDQKIPSDLRNFFKPSSTKKKTNVGKTDESVSKKVEEIDQQELVDEVSEAVSYNGQVRQYTVQCSF